MAFLRETTGSLKAYFIVIGLIGCISQPIAFLFRSQTEGFNIYSTAISFLFSFAFLSIGILFRKLRIESPKIITAVVSANLGFAIVSFLLRSINNIQGPPLIVQFLLLVVGFLIVWYIIKSVNRLSLEEQGKNAV